MPWPVTHILIAEQVFDRCFNHLDKQAFLIGTCFPDIRYPAKIERKRTHFSDLTLSQIGSQPPFQAGLCFHNLVDSIWNAYVRRQHDNLFVELPHDQAMYHTLKILQDKYLYHQLSAWSRIAALFATVLPEERVFGIREDMLGLWHKMLARYLQKPPTIDDLHMLSLSLPENLVTEIRHNVLQYEHHPPLKRIMTGFYLEFPDLIELD